MMSFSRNKSARRKTYLALISSIETLLRDKFAQRFETDGLTQAGLAEKLGVDRSAINRRLLGRSNMTVETIADMVWALDCRAKLQLIDNRDPMAGNAFLSDVGNIYISTPQNLVEGGIPTQLKISAEYTAS